MAPGALSTCDLRARVGPQRHRKRRYAFGASLMAVTIGTGVAVVNASTNVIHYPGSQGWAPIYAQIPHSGSPMPRVIATLRNGTPVAIVCTGAGTSQGSWWRNTPTTVWDGIVINGQRGYTSDAWVDTHQMGPVTTTPCSAASSGTSLTLTGRVSCFSDGTTATGVSAATTPGIAVARSDTLGGWWMVRFPNGRSLRLRQIDWGPAAWTGRVVDVSLPAAHLAGYGGSCWTFPTDSIVTAEFLGH